jgi:hypothetical protein
LKPIFKNILSSELLSTILFKNTFLTREITRQTSSLSFKITQTMHQEVDIINNVHVDEILVLSDFKNKN